MHNSIAELQKNICTQFGASCEPCPNDLKVGIAKNIRDGVMPINGLRLKPEENTSGWFIWAGEFSDGSDFFVPIHVEHLAEWCPSAIPYLLLPAGWRFQVAPNHEDVWFDASLLTDAA